MFTKFAAALAAVALVGVALPAAAASDPIKTEAKPAVTAPRTQAQLPADAKTVAKPAITQQAKTPADAKTGQTAKDEKKPGATQSTTTQSTITPGTNPTQPVVR